MAAYNILTLVNLALRRAGNRKQIASLAAPTDDARWFVKQIDLIHKRIATRAPWDWMRKEYELTLLPAQTAKTVDVTQNSKAFATYSGSLDTTKHLGALMWVKAAGFHDFMRIGTLGSATAGNFTTEWPGANGTGVACEVHQDTYALPADFWKPLSKSSFVSAPWKMTPLDPERFLRARSYQETRNPTFAITGQPEIFTLWGAPNPQTPPTAQSVIPKLMVYPFPLKEQDITLRYYRRPTDLDTGTDTPIPDIPEKWQEILLDRVLSLWFLYKLPDARKRAAHQAAYMEKLARMLGTVERTSDRAAMVPAQTGRGEQF